MRTSQGAQGLRCGGCAKRQPKHLAHRKKACIDAVADWRAMRCLRDKRMDSAPPERTVAERLTVDALRALETGIPESLANIVRIP